MRRLLALCGLVSLVSGCGGGGGTVAPSIVGTWSVRSIRFTDTNTTVTCPGTAVHLGQNVPCGANDVFVFSSNNVLSDETGVLGTYRNDGNNNYTLFAPQQIPVSFEFSNNGNTAVMIAYYGDGTREGYTTIERQ